MKKYEVIADFIDKNTNVLYQIGSDYPSPSAKRGNELIEKGFLKELESTKGDNDESGKL